MLTIFREKKPESYSWVVNTVELERVLLQIDGIDSCTVHFRELGTMFWYEYVHEKASYVIETGSFSGVGVKNIKDTISTVVFPKFVIWAREVSSLPAGPTRLHKNPHFGAIVINNGIKYQIT